MCSINACGLRLGASFLALDRKDVSTIPACKTERRAQFRIIDFSPCFAFARVLLLN